MIQTHTLAWKNSKPSVVMAIALVLVVLLALWLGNELRPGVQHQTPLDPAEAWLAAHYPRLLTRTKANELYRSLISRYWVPQTGLFLSFPSTPDKRLIQQSATYDQAIAGVLLLHLGDTEKVGRLLAFFEKAWTDAASRSGPRLNVHGLANFYNGYFSTEGVEKIMHVGPNAWIGLLASRYARKTNDAPALALALNIAHWIMDQVPHQDGAVSMGQIAWNSVPWPKIFSTENNLSTYAFLTDLAQSKNISPEDRSRIEKEREGIALWLIRKAYDPVQGTVLRGFHPQGLDTAGAIDSYTWFISSLRPAFLRSHHIDPGRLISRAGRDFTVQVDGHRGIDCVDQRMSEATYDDALRMQYKDPNFLRPQHDDHRLIWFEGQSQYIVALQDAAVDTVRDVFSRKSPGSYPQLLASADAWLHEAKLLTNEMDQASFATGDGTVYPLATQGRFYLHGWPAPTPTSEHLADAAAPLIWRLFVGMGYEPLSDTALNPATDYHLKLVKGPAIRNAGTAILYGASEEMSVQAWRLYEQGNSDGAWRQAKATISLWEEDAKVLQRLKTTEVGTYYTFDGTVESYQRIHDYWALNDVAASYFLLAKISDQERNYAEANRYLSTILSDFPLAQMWDKRGWFWDPIDTIKSDFADLDPTHYGDLADKIPDLPAIPVGLVDKASNLEPYFARKS